MVNYFFAGVASGALFGVLDRIIKQNPVAERLYQRVKYPVAGPRRYPDAIFVDLVYGAVMVAAFLLVYNRLPGDSTLAKGISFGLVIWFFRIGLNAVFLGYRFRLNHRLLLYLLVTGLGEYLAQGLLIGLLVQPLS